MLKKYIETHSKRNGAKATSQQRKTQSNNLFTEGLPVGFSSRPGLGRTPCYPQLPLTSAVGIQRDGAH